MNVERFASEKMRVFLSRTPLSAIFQCDVLFWLRATWTRILSMSGTLDGRKVVVFRTMHVGNNGSCRTLEK